MCLFQGKVGSIWRNLFLFFGRFYVAEFNSTHLRYCNIKYTRLFEFLKLSYRSNGGILFININSNPWSIFYNIIYEYSHSHQAKCAFSFSTEIWNCFFFFFGCSISEHEGRPKAAFVSIIGDDYLQYGIQRFKISKNFCQNHWIASNLIGWVPYYKNNGKTYLSTTCRRLKVFFKPLTIHWSPE